MYDLDAHVAKIRELYGKRRTLMYDSMKKYFPQGLSFTYPEGGLFTWVTLPENIDAKAIMPEVIKRKSLTYRAEPSIPTAATATTSV